jgi:protein-tyrosine-phosphatase
MAEAILKLKQQKGIAGKFQDWTISSAGTRVISKEGESRHGQKLKDLLPVTQEVITSVKEIGMDISDWSRTQLSPDILKSADLVVVMAEPHTIPEYLAEFPGVLYWDVEDPKGLPLEKNQEIRDIIARLIDTL